MIHFLRLVAAWLAMGLLTCAAFAITTDWWIVVVLWVAWSWFIGATWAYFRSAICKDVRFSGDRERDLR